MVKLRKEKNDNNERNKIGNIGFLANGDDYMDDDLDGKGAAIAAAQTATAKTKDQRSKTKDSGKSKTTNDQRPTTNDQSDDTVYFFALGGLEHVGQNMYVYKYRGKYLVVDAGMGFLEGEFEGADTKYPDTKFLEKHKKDVLAFVITHGHEDHTGALKYIWEKFRAPIYCTRFVEKFMRKTFNGVGIETKPDDFRIFNHNGDNFNIGPFELETFHVSHSVPEANMIVIKTAQGKILHTGDWTFNDGNPIEPMTDYARLREIGSDPDLLAVVGDSTEIARQPVQTTELEVRDTLTEIFRKAPGRVLVTGYSRSIGRLKMLAEAARAAGRTPAIKERSNSRAVPYVGLPEFREIGTELGYLAKDDLALHKDIRDLPAEKQVIFLTGSQGEKYAMLTRLCRGDVKELQLQPTDTVVFSAIVIPGREKDVSFLYNRLARLGVHYHTIYDTPKVHANGHAGRPEFERFYDMVHPQVIIPMHGEYVAEMLHAKMAIERGGAKHMMLVRNGEVIALKRNQPPYVTETVYTGFIVLEGEQEHSGSSPIFKTRKKLMLHGAVFVTLPMDKRGFLKGAPEVSSAGIFETDEMGFMKKQIQVEITKAVNDMGKAERKQQRNIETVVQNTVNSVIRPTLGKTKKPDITVHFIMK